MMMFRFIPVFLIGLGIVFFLKSRHVLVDRRVVTGRDEVLEIKSGETDATLFRLAKDNDGKVTLSDVVIGTGMNMKEAEEYMDSIADGSHVSIEVDDNGRLVYVFPEISSNSWGKEKD